MIAIGKRLPHLEEVEGAERMSSPRPFVRPGVPFRSRASFCRYPPALVLLPIQGGRDAFHVLNGNVDVVPCRPGMTRRTRTAAALIFPYTNKTCSLRRNSIATVETRRVSASARAGRYPTG